MTEKDPVDVRVDLEKYGISRRTMMRAVGMSALAGGVATGSVSAQAESNNEIYDPYPAWETTEHHRVTSSDGTELHVDETGDKESQAILLIHGAYQSRLAWEKQMVDGLSDDFRLAAMDLRGHGISDKPESGDAYTAERWADDVHAVINTLDLTDPVLVGWSFGGWIINDYIAHYGTDQITSINYVSTSGGAVVDGDGEEREIDDIRAGEETYREKVESLNEFVGMLTYDDLSPRDHYFFLGFNLITAIGAVSRTVNYTDLLSEIDVPTLVTQGEEDEIVSRAQAENLNENIPNSQISYYPDVGHSPFWEEPERFNRELREFVNETSDQSRC